MRGNDQVIAQLNIALKEELTAINQYFLHAEMCHNWGYHKLGDYIRKQSIDEMKHAEELIERLLFLDATPKMEYMELSIGSNVKQQLEADLKLEQNAVDVQRRGQGLARRRRRRVARPVFEAASDEEEHVDWLEAQMQPDQGHGLRAVPVEPDRGSEGLVVKSQRPTPNAQSNIRLGIGSWELGVDLTDINLELGGLLLDMAAVAGESPRGWGYSRAAKAVLRIDDPITPLVESNTLSSVSGIGPTTDRIARELIVDGASPFVEQSIRDAGKEEAVAKLRALRQHFLSRAAVKEILGRRGSPSRNRYRGDFQMHSVWSDGAETLGSIVDACIARGYSCAGITDHSYGLAIAGGMTMAQVKEQHAEIDALNREARRNVPACSRASKPTSGPMARSTWRSTSFGCSSSSLRRRIHCCARRSIRRRGWPGRSSSVEWRSSAIRWAASSTSVRVCGALGQGVQDCREAAGRD